MAEYSVGKKAAAIVLHQMFLVLMVTSIFTSGYYERLRHTGSMTFWMLAVVGLVGTFIALAYLTSAAGRKSESDESVSLNWVDRIYGDLLTLIFVVGIYVIARICMRLSIRSFSLEGLVITVGSIGYIFDVLFLIYYLSVVRRIKSGMLYKQTLICRLCETGRVFLQNRKKNRKGIPTRRNEERWRIQEALEAIAGGAIETKLDEEQFHGQEKEMARALNCISQGLKQAVSESIRNERMKADLITNVSHDIKTPLTSIVNYVDLLKRENLENENANRYIRVLDDKSQRLKQLTEDLVEVSKISSGSLKLDMQNIDFVELIYQTGGEFNERFEARGLTIVTKLANTPVMISADGRQLYRAIENLYTNAAKYALENTRVYVELAVNDGLAVFSIKNIAKNAISAELTDSGNELTERFVRGEVSRTTEGSGLGLSIAKSLTVLMGGDFKIHADGDLFIATISFKIA